MDTNLYLAVAMYKVNAKKYGVRYLDEIIAVFNSLELTEQLIKNHHTLYLNKPSSKFHLGFRIDEIKVVEQIDGTNETPNDLVKCRFYDKYGVKQMENE